MTLFLERVFLSQFEGYPVHLQLGVLHGSWRYNRVSSPPHFSVAADGHNNAKPGQPRVDHFSICNAEAGSFAGVAIREL